MYSDIHKQLVRANRGRGMPREQSLIDDDPELQWQMIGEPRHIFDRLVNDSVRLNYDVENNDMYKRQKQNDVNRNVKIQTPEIGKVMYQFTGGSSNPNSFARSFVKSKRMSYVPHNSIELLQNANGSYRDRLNLFNVQPLQRRDPYGPNTDPSELMNLGITV